MSKQKQSNNECPLKTRLEQYSGIVDVDFDGVFYTVTTDNGIVEIWSEKEAEEFLNQ